MFKISKENNRYMNKIIMTQTTNVELYKNKIGKYKPNQI